jgi:hypothetical protein
MKVMMSTGNAKRVNKALLFINDHEGLNPNRMGAIWRSYFNNVHRKAILDPYEERLAFNILSSIISTLVNKTNLTDKERADLTKEIQDFIKNHPKAVDLKEVLIEPFQEDPKKIKEIEKLFSIEIKNEINFLYTNKQEENSGGFGQVLEESKRKNDNDKKNKIIQEKKPNNGDMSFS